METGGSEPGAISSLHVTTEQGWGGGEEKALLLVSGLRRRRLPAVFAAAPRSPVFRRALERGLEPAAFSSFNEADPLAVMRLAALLRRLRPAVLHLHSAHALSLGLLAAPFAPSVVRVVARRVIASIHRHRFLRVNRLKYTVGVHRVIAVSTAVRDALGADGVPREKIAVVRSGVDPSRFDPLPAPDRASVLRELDLPGGVPLVASVGSLTAAKGHETLVRAAPAVLSRRDAAFLIAGEGPCRRELERLVRRLGLQGRVRLPGFRDDVGRILASADLFVFPSLAEGLGTSLLDCLLLGTPVVASRIGGIPEVLGEDGLGVLVPPGDAVSLAGAIVSALEHPERPRARALEGRRRVLSGFTSDRMVEETIAVYAEAIEERRGAATGASCSRRVPR